MCQSSNHMSQHVARSIWKMHAPWYQHMLPIIHHNIYQWKLKYVPSMYTNRSSSIHTHGLVSCTRDFILHNPIDEQLNLHQIVSESTTNNVGPYNKVLYHHIKMQSMCIAFFSRIYYIYMVFFTTTHICTRPIQC